MPKYYVQSGNLQVITTASDPRGAAIWAVHRALAHSLPFLNDEAEGLAKAGAAAPQLDESVQVSEQGFGAEVGHTYGTLEIIGEWNELLLAIDRMQQRFARAEAVC
jgi:hypothetical protein